MSAVQPDPGSCRAPLHRCYVRLADMLVHNSRWDCDALLIGADAFVELARECRAGGQDVRAAEADMLADRLRTEAPRRLRPSPFRRSELLDLAVEQQRCASAQGLQINDGEALSRAADILAARNKHVLGGVA